MMLGAKRVVLAPSAITRLGQRSGWTKAQPYEKELLPPEIVPRTDTGRTEGACSLRYHSLRPSQRLDQGLAVRKGTFPSEIRL